jgi:hypothetical protein
MKKYLLITLLYFAFFKLYGQTTQNFVEGKVSYITMQNIYVRFEATGMVQKGDTIFIRKDQKLVPLFISESVSSTSSVGKPLGNYDVKPGDAAFIKIKKDTRKQVKESPPVGIATQGRDTIQTQLSKATAKAKPDSERSEKIRGRIGVSSYSNFSNSSTFSQRMRYTFSLTADHISGSKISTDTYIMFTHRFDHWADVKDNIFSALKIYSLNVNYDLSDKTRLSFGRKINQHISGIGAIDGLQAETRAGSFTFGAVIGSNPDYSDYSFNAKLLEYGAYLSHEGKNKNGSMVNSFAIFEQTSHGMTDRRFAYFQHDNSLAKNINLYASSELDLYALENGLPINTIRLTSLYLSLRYRMSRQLSAYLSYDARKNVIYYETFKNYLDQLLLDATRQGYQLRINYRPTNNITSGITGGYRFQKKDPKPMLNVNGFLTFSQVPGINASVNLTANWLQTSYVDGMIYGIQIYRDIVPSKLSTGIYYRLADNQYSNYSSNSIQQMAQFELSWRISKKLSFSANYDGTFDRETKYHSIYINLIQRF